ncbi:PHB depolymerase family esterase [Fibrobacter sp. UWEL]|uniref:alpha/beta hydrolase family esterase n=1 Tax=Fibrobacter sp. UWEL TaxID=1896209 RepID=UPI000913BBA1|nr:hypothetical protein [Fibrobacter sp. UWEL]SHK99538.1 Poly(3-hydroxybutyrate) depolymerase [Fibrobacter sp. UWEL]
MKRRFLGLALLTTAAIFMACDDDSGVSPKTDEPIVSLESSSSVDMGIPGSSATDPNIGGDPIVANSSSDALVPVPTSSATIPGSSATVPAVSSSSVAPVASSGSIAPVASSSSKTVVASSSSAKVTPSSSSAAPVPSSSSVAPMAKIEGVYDYQKGNAAAPSRGCGKNSTLQKTKSVENGDRFEMNVNGLNREFFITLPKNYDNTKPHKLLFAMHCMGSNAEDFVHHSPDQDHPSPYYGQQNLDKNGDYIFVAPRGDTDGSPWATADDKDHKFFDKLLTTMEDNYCIDTSRVFVTGFSFGSMITNSLAQVFQHRIRAAVTYAVADWNIYIPTNKGKPIAWMDVHGTQDNLCSYSRLSSSITRILKNNGPNGTDVSSEINDWQKYTGGNTHVCYDFKKVDPNHPVRVCTWGGGHQWTANDNGGWQNTWVPEDVHKFLEQF